MRAVENKAASKPRPRIREVAAITATVGLLAFTGVGVANAASINDTSVMDSKSVTGKHTPPGSTFGNTIPHHVYKLVDGKCLNEFWLLPDHYQAVGEWMSDYGTWDAEPDYITAYSAGLCDGKNLDNPYWNITNAGLNENDFLA